MGNTESEAEVLLRENPEETEMHRRGEATLRCPANRCM